MPDSAVLGPALVGPVLVGSVLPDSRTRLKWGAAVVLLLAALGVAVLISALGSHGTSTPVEVASASPVPQGASAAIYVHLLGAVAAPGLYELPEGARAVDALAAAGGFTDTADRTQVNLARFLSDGEQIIVPVIGEVPAAGAEAAGTIGGKVNLNTADAATLQTLPRVGPAMSARIIAWRDANGRFSAIDELRSVSGIGEKTFAALRDLVTV